MFVMLHWNIIAVTSEFIKPYTFQFCLKYFQIKKRCGHILFFMDYLFLISNI